GVGGDDDAAGAVLCGSQQRRAGRRRGRRRTRQRTRAVVQLQPARAIEARAVHAREQVHPVRPRTGRGEVREDPVWRGVVALVVGDGVIGDLDPEAGQQRVEVVVVLVLLLLAEDDQPAAAVYEGL